MRGFGKVDVHYNYLNHSVLFYFLCYVTMNYSALDCVVSVTVFTPQMLSNGHTDLNEYETKVR